MQGGGLVFLLRQTCPSLLTKGQIFPHLLREPVSQSFVHENCYFQNTWRLFSLSRRSSLYFFFENVIVWGKGKTLLWQKRPEKDNFFVSDAVRQPNDSKGGRGNNRADEVKCLCVRIWKHRDIWQKVAWRAAGQESCTGGMQQQFDVIIHFHHSHVCMTEAGVCEEFLPVLFAAGHISTAHHLVSDGRAQRHSLARSHCCHPNQMQQFGTRICRVLKVMVCKLPINVWGLLDFIYGL